MDVLLDNGAAAVTGPVGVFGGGDGFLLLVRL